MNEAKRGCFTAFRIDMSGEHEQGGRLPGVFNLFRHLWQLKRRIEVFPELAKSADGDVEMGCFKRIPRGVDPNAATSEPFTIAQHIAYETASGNNIFGLKGACPLDLCLPGV